MKTNPAFSAALQKLSHPLSLAALALVVLNDLVLRAFWPSWWTGKFSDIGVIFFLPLLLSTLLTLALGRRTRLAAGLGFGSVLLAFLLLKASAAANHWLTGWLPLRAVYDPSDLLVLPAWGAALALWLGPASPSPRRAPRWRLALLPLAALVTLADAAAPSYGIECLSLENGTLFSHSMYTVLTSTDGGKTWLVKEGERGELCERKEDGESFDLTSPNGVRYRGTIGGGIERSADGSVWQTVYAPVLLSEAEETYLRKTVTSNFFYRPGPLDALVDPGSGNLVLAMGLEGVLVVPEQGRPVWAAAGQYHHRALESGGLGALFFLLSGELWLVLGAGLLWLVTACLRMGRMSMPMIVLTVFGWLFIAGEGFALTPELANSSYTGMFTSLAVIFASLWTLGLLIATVIRVRRRISRLLVRLFFMLLILPFLLAPYILWSVNLIPYYWIAQAAAGGLILLLIIPAVLTGRR